MKDCSDILAPYAMGYVFGYSIADDISARDLQAKHKQWYAGKSTTLHKCPTTQQTIQLNTLRVHTLLLIKSFFDNKS